jgi:toxin-antitoxin system PIN domain toxin
MSLFFPDVNVWLALSDDGHTHNSVAWQWREQLPLDATLVFSRHTQTGLLRLLTNPSVMSGKVVTLREAWAVYDRWMEDPSAVFYPEPRAVDVEFRRFTAPLGGKAASNWVGDCWILAFAHAAQTSLVTFDKALYDFARKHGHAAVMPS